MLPDKQNKSSPTAKHCNWCLLLAPFIQSFQRLASYLHITYIGCTTDVISQVVLALPLQK